MGLIKIASDDASDNATDTGTKNKPIFDTARIAGAGGGIGGMLGTAAANLGLYGLVSKMKEKQLFTPEEEKQLFALAGNPNVTAVTPGSAGPQFIPGIGFGSKDYFLGKTNPAADVIHRFPGAGSTAHEAGHMAGLLGNARAPKAIKGLYRALDLGGRASNMLGLSGFISLERALAAEQNDGKEDRALQALDYLNRAASATMLGEEAGATLYGGYLTSKLKGNKAALGMIARHLPALGTYGILAAGNNVLVPYLTRKAYRWAKDKNKEDTQ